MWTFFFKTKSIKIENPVALSRKQSGLVMGSSCLIQMVSTMKISPFSLALSKLKTSEMDLTDPQAITMHLKSKVNAKLCLRALSHFLLDPSFPVYLTCSKENNDQ